MCVFFYNNIDIFFHKWEHKKNYTQTLWMSRVTAIVTGGNKWALKVGTQYICNYK